uniref:Uncharacterized protein n=1 Tax=Cacopsylla melanoneura TaxID=428564 RepID=A0A8D9BID8_9HEMI
MLMHCSSDHFLVCEKLLCLISWVAPITFHTTPLQVSLIVYVLAVVRIMTFFSGSLLMLHYVMRYTVYHLMYNQVRKENIVSGGHKKDFQHTIGKGITPALQTTPLYTYTCLQYKPCETHLSYTGFCKEYGGC